MREMIPRNDQVLIKPDPDCPRGTDVGKPYASSSLILSPDGALEPARTGKVLAVGPGRRQDGRVIPLTVKPGDRVLFQKFAGVIFDNQEFDGQFAGLRLIREDQIETILEASNGTRS